MGPEKITLKDVAKASGVSINTVSRALNNKPDVSPETKQKVVDAASKLGYVPNPLAQGLRGKYSRSIGVIVADIANPFFAEVIQGIEEVAFDRGFAITVGNSGEDAQKENYLAKTLIEQRVAGILMTPTQRDDQVPKLLMARGTPFVLMARRFEMLTANAVLNDDYSGAYQAVDYLIHKGHKKILFLNGPGHMWSAAQRLQGYRKCLEDSGMIVDDKYIRTCEPNMRCAYEKMGEILKDGLELDAVFTFSDYMALGAMKALNERSVSIPNDVSVMGYDGIDIGEMINPALSTVAIFKRRLGIEATRILIDMIEDSDLDSPRQITLPPKLVIRESTK